MYSTSFLQPSGKKSHIVNTRLHSAYAESNWSFATALIWNSFETLRINKYKILSKEPFSLETHKSNVCIFPPAEGILTSI